MAVFIRVVRLLDQLPVNIPPLLGVLQSSQIGIGFDHRINCLTDSLLINPLHIDVQAIHRLDRQVAFGDQLTLAQGFIGASLPDIDVQARLLLLFS